MVGFLLYSMKYLYRMDNRLQEIFDKYNVSEKNNSTGNLKKLEKTISELQKLDKVLLLPC